MGLLAKVDNVGLRIFLSGLDKEFLGAEVTIIMNNSFVHHVSKVEKILGYLVFIQLLFKDKLSIVILSLYVGVSTETNVTNDYLESQIK
ncbi:hypothetical protein G9A89_010779 [Geosiphon pyriformis]|nr:hypothetical protein G9A89_010779 [Geosiphon pyriformis]